MTMTKIEAEKTVELVVRFTPDFERENPFIPDDQRIQVRNPTVFSVDSVPSAIPEWAITFQWGQRPVLIDADGNRYVGQIMWFGEPQRVSNFLYGSAYHRPARLTFAEQDMVRWVGASYLRHAEQLQQEYPPDTLTAHTRPNRIRKEPLAKRRAHEMTIIKDRRSEY